MSVIFVKNEHHLRIVTHFFLNIGRKTFSYSKILKSHNFHPKLTDIDHVSPIFRNSISYIPKFPSSNFSFSIKEWRNEKNPFLKQTCHSIFFKMNVVCTVKLYLRISLTLLIWLVWFSLKGSYHVGETFDMLKLVVWWFQISFWFFWIPPPTPLNS